MRGRAEDLMKVLSLNHLVDFDRKFSFSVELGGVGDVSVPPLGGLGSSLSSLQ